MALQSLTGPIPTASWLTLFFTGMHAAPFRLAHGEKKREYCLTVTAALPVSPVFRWRLTGGLQHFCIKIMC